MDEWTDGRFSRVNSVDHSSYVKSWNLVGWCLWSKMNRVIAEREIPLRTQKPRSGSLKGAIT